MDIEDGVRPRLKGLLRMVEGVLFCCLSAATILWVGDRIRDLNFDPISVTPCTTGTCQPASEPDPWARYVALRDARGIRTFSPQNFCAMAVALLEEEATAPATDRVIADLETRGVIIVARAEDDTALVSPGRNNDGWGDVLRDVFRFGTSRGCHPSNYAPVIRPLIVAWILVLLLRLFRNRQTKWRMR